MLAFAVVNPLLVTARSDNSDLLTHTTLQIDGSMSTLSAAQVIRALQRVPGVLLAEVNAASARAIVAHDAAVPSASLLAAATGAGVHAEIVADTRAPAISVDTAAQLQRARLRRLVTVATTVFVMLALVDALAPNIAQKHWVLPVFLAALWVFFVAEGFVGRRRP